MITANLGVRFLLLSINSSIAKTLIYEVKDDELKIDALRILCQKYTPQYMEAFKVAAFGSLTSQIFMNLRFKA